MRIRSSTLRVSRSASSHSASATCVRTPAPEERGRERHSSALAARRGCVVLCFLSLLPSVPQLVLWSCSSDATLVIYFCPGTPPPPPSAGSGLTDPAPWRSPSERAPPFSLGAARASRRGLRSPRRSLRGAPLQQFAFSPLSQIHLRTILTDPCTLQILQSLVAHAALGSAGVLGSTAAGGLAGLSVALVAIGLQFVQQRGVQHFRERHAVSSPRLLRDASLPAAAVFAGVGVALWLVDLQAGGTAAAGARAAPAPAWLLLLLVLSCVCGAMNNVMCFSVAAQRNGVLKQKVRLRTVVVGAGPPPQHLLMPFFCEPGSIHANVTGKSIKSGN